MRALDIDASFDQFTIARLRHHLVGHPLMTTESLTELALRIDPDYVRFHDEKRQLATRMSQMLSTDPTRDALRRAIDNLGQRSAFVQIINVSVTPFHLDHEQNFLCHSRGPKTFYVWNHRDRSVVGERAAARRSGG